jgi:glycosyltransferase involved in cell wall biosynthesis
MAEEGKEIQMTPPQPSQEDRVRNSIQKLENKNSSFLFFVAGTPNPAASIYEIYFHAKTVKNLGYDVKILTDSKDYKIPEWIEKELTDFPHQSVEEVKLTVGPEDVLIIPEIFSNVMEQTKNLPCIRVGLLQSVDYMINGLMPGVDWKSFGIEKIITTSDNLKDLVHEYYGKNYDVKVSNPAIPEYFKYNGELKRPVISIVGRNPNEIAKIVKLFYSKYPQYSWITFDSMFTDSKPPQPMRRKDYAERLKKNFAAVWVDRISSFGTFPLECMAAGTIPIGLVPDIQPEYLLDEDGEPKENVGVWTNDIYAIPILIGDVVTKFLDDTIGDEIIETMSEVASKYNVENATKKLGDIYQELLNERLTMFKNTLEKLENKPEITEETKQD